MTAMKRCPRCGETKSADGFNRNRSQRDGLATQCKECRLAYQRAYDDAHLEERRTYREDHREERCTYDRTYREANREKIAERARAYRDAHLEEIRAKGRAYGEAHREERNTMERDRRALLGNPTQERWKEITTKYATRRGEPWSEAEDAYLAASTDRIVDDALSLKRTYESVKKRIAHLRKRGISLARDAH